VFFKGGKGDGILGSICRKLEFPIRFVVYDFAIAINRVTRVSVFTKMHLRVYFKIYEVTDIVVTVIQPEMILSNSYAVYYWQSLIPDLTGQSSVLGCISYLSHQLAIADNVCSGKLCEYLPL
jgi:hypothetical protein